MPGSVLNSLYEFTSSSHIIRCEHILTPHRVNQFYPHFTEEETGVQRDSLFCPASHSWYVGQIEGEKGRGFAQSSVAWRPRRCPASTQGPVPWTKAGLQGCTSNCLDSSSGIGWFLKNPFRVGVMKDPPPARRFRKSLPLLHQSASAWSGLAGLCQALVENNVSRKAPQLSWGFLSWIEADPLPVLPLWSHWVAPGLVVKASQVQILLLPPTGCVTLGKF